MNFAKKMLGLFLSLCLALSCGIPAFAAGATISGDANIFVPAKGDFLVAEYTMLDSDGEKIENAQWSIEGTTPSGIYLDSETGKVVVNGSEIATGSFTLKAQKGGESASLKITIPDVIIDLDFERYDVGTTGNFKVPARKLSDGADVGNMSNSRSDTKAKIAEETSGNRYLSATSSWPGYWMILPRWSASAIQNSRKVTVDFDVLNPGTVVNLMKENANTAFSISTESNALKVGGVLQDYTFSTTEWTNIKVSLDYEAFTYDVIVGGKNLGTFNMASKSYNYLNQLYTECKAVDNLRVYSGRPGKAEIASDIPSEIAVGSSGAKFPIASSISIGGVAIPGNINWSTEANGITISDGFVNIESGASRGEIILTADAGLFKNDYTITITDALEVGTNELIDASALRGKSVIKAVLKGENVIVNGFSGGIELPSAEDECELYIYIDEFATNCKIIFDNKLIFDESYEELSTVQLENAEVSYLYAGSIYDEAPMAFDAALSGRTVVGQSVGVSYTYFSNFYEKEGQEIIWYLDGEEVLTGDNFLIDSNMIGKTIKASLKVTGGNLESEIVETEESVIQDMYSVAKTDSGVEITVIGTGEEFTFVAVVTWIKDGKDIKTVAKKITGYDAEIFEEFSAGTEFDGARVCLMNSDLTPLAPEKYAGVSEVVIPSSGKSEAGISYEDGKIYLYDTAKSMTTVMVFNPENDNNFAKAYDSVSATGMETVWSDRLCYVSVINADAVIDIEEKLSGVYYAKAVTADSVVYEKNFVFGAEKLFTENILASLSEEDFVKAIENCADVDSAKAAEIYLSYKNTDSTKLAKLMQGEEYDMDKFETAVLLSSYFNNKDNKEALVANLEEKELPTEGIELLYKNNVFAETTELIVLEEGIEKALESTFEKAVLQGILKSGNYMETKVYLEAVTERKVTNNMARSFTAKGYKNLEELKEAVSLYKEPSSSGGGGGGGGSSGGSIGGTSENIGSIGGTTSTVNKEIESEKETNKALFSDVDKSHWAREDIEYLVGKKIVSGIGDGSFAPDKSITRAEFVKIITEAFPYVSDGEEVKFSDINESDWYYKYVSKASAAGIITGDGRAFHPESPITRQDAAVILYRVLNNLDVKLEEVEGSATDSSNIAAYALKAVNSLYGSGIINGMEDGSFMPLNNLTRAQTAAIVARILK